MVRKPAQKGRPSDDAETRAEASVGIHLYFYLRFPQISYPLLICSSRRWQEKHLQDTKKPRLQEVTFSASTENGHALCQGPQESKRNP